MKTLFIYKLCINNVKQIKKYRIKDNSTVKKIDWIEEKCDKGDNSNFFVAIRSHPTFTLSDCAQVTVSDYKVDTIVLDILFIEC